MSDGQQQPYEAHVNAGNGIPPRRPTMSFEDIARGFAQAMIAVGAGWSIPCSVQTPDENGIVTEHMITPAQLVMNLTLALQETRDAVDDFSDVMTEAEEAMDEPEPPRKRKRRK